jgi:PKD repeat protein
MVVAVSVVGATMYSQVDVTDGCTLATSGFSPPFPTVSETYQYDNGTLFFELSNPGEDALEVNNITVRDSDTTLGVIGVEQELLGDGTASVTTNRFQSSENCFQADLNLNYESESLQGLTAQGTLQGKISIVPLVAVFDLNTTSVSKEGTVKFNASETEGQNSIENYTWEFGDGSTATGETATHSYTQNGVYIVRLTVEDSQGITDTSTKRVYVGGVLTRSGGEITRLGFENTLATGCIGPNCQNRTGNDDQPVSTSGGYTEGTVFAEELVMTDNTMCVTDIQSFRTDEGCNLYRQGDDTTLSENNYNLTGSLRTPNVKPRNQSICIGDCLKQ